MLLKDLRKIWRNYMDNSFTIGFEKTAFTRKQRSDLENEMHSFNKRESRPSKLVPRGLKGGGTFGAIIGAGAGLAKHKPIRGGVKGALIGAGIGGALSGLSSLYWQKRDKSYLSNVSDKNLSRGVKSIRKYRSGDKDALNRNVLKVLKEQGKM